MTNTAPPFAFSPPPSDADVHWFGASRRTVGGQPDSRYGWLPLPDGPCIVKAMDPDLVAYNKTLLDHERRMLRRLHDLKAPCPELLDVGRADWLVTRFAGVSLQRLEHPGGLQGTHPAARFPFSERLAVWMHLLRRMQPLTDAGVLVVDLYEANLLVPLTEGTHGQLRLHEPALIDHAHTLEAGMKIRRPVWVDRDMERIAPELREALRQDQEALVAAFRAAGAALPGYSRLPGQRDEHSRRIWAEYDAPQQLQRLLDAGQLSRDHAMQFAAGATMARLLQAYPQHAQRAALARVLRQMTEPEPGNRYATLTEAAEALEGVLRPLPMVSQHVYAELSPADLKTPETAMDTPGPESTARPGRAAALAASPERKAGTTAPRTSAAQPASALSDHWLYALAAAGAALGMLLPLPW